MSRPDRPLWQWSAAEIESAVRAGTTSVDEVVAAHEAQASAWDPHVHAFLTRIPGGLRDGAGGDGAAKPARPLLTGVPVAVKDNICTRGVATSCGSRILEGYVPPYDATVIGRLKSHGAVIVGKTNLDEFAMGSSTENSGFGPSRNPYDVTRVPGGSSGGSAVAVATGMATVGLGSETGGSVRQPASFTNLLGLKPTYGRLSRYGLVAFASSMDQVGIFSRSASDGARVLAALSGHDPSDATSLPDPALDFDTLDLGPDTAQGLVVGVPRALLAEGLDPDVEEGQRIFEAALLAAGATVREVTLLPPSSWVATYYLLATAEASSNLARFDGVRYGLRAPAQNVLELYRQTREAGFGAEVKRRILLGTYALSAGYYDAYYRKAQKARRRIQNDLLAALEGCDALLFPTSPTPAFKLGEKADDPLAMYLSDIFTIGANLAGLPALAVPAGFTGGGLPVGVQFTARACREDVLYRLAAAVEHQLTDPAERRWPTKPS
ncbi:MAG: Asp-tRNA(Asn)/Glu-tRNA(Gln) amidotransferase subunit GatA [Candidatus Eiseniibacteriota bacterium]